MSARIIRSKKAIKSDIRRRKTSAVSKIIAGTSVSADKVMRMLTNMDGVSIRLYESGGVMYVENLMFSSKS